MPIIFVHGVASRLNTAAKSHEKTWEFIEQKLREHVAPKIASDPDNVLIKEAYWGDEGVPEIEKCIPDTERVKEAFQKRGCWIEHILKEGWDDITILDALKRLRDLPGNRTQRILDGRRPLLNAQAALFLGDIFTYLRKSGTPEKPGSIIEKLLNILSEAHENQKQRKGEKLIVISHSMGGQLVYDLVSYYLPEMSNMPKYNDYKDIKIDFWCSAASQVGLFQEMGLFLANADSDTKVKVPFPDKHLNIWWNLWDDNDYLSFTAEPFFAEVLDDLYDSGQSAFKAHTSHFEQPDFYIELGKKITMAEVVKWQRNQFLQKFVLNIIEEVKFILRHVPGMRDAAFDQFVHAILKFKLRNGAMIKTWKNGLGCDHVFLADNRGKLIYGGYVLWNDSKELDDALEKIRNKFGEREE